MEERVKKNKVVSGNVRKKKKSGLSKFAEIFISSDAGDVKTYIVRDVVVPAVRDLLVDTIKKGAEMIFYGDGYRSSSNKPKNYTKYAYGSNKRSRSQYRSEYESRSFDEIVYESRGEAAAVLEQLDDVIDEYGSVSILDLYDFSGLSGGTPSDAKYGWDDLKTAKVIRGGGGWMIRLPRAIPID